MTKKTNFEIGLLYLIQDYFNQVLFKSEVTLHEELLPNRISSLLGSDVGSSVPTYFHEVADDNFKPCSAGLTEDEIFFALDKYYEEIIDVGSRWFDLLRCDDYEEAA